MNLYLSLCVLVSFMGFCESKKLKEITIDNCEVCMTFIGKFIDYNGGETDEEKVKGKFRDLCKNTKKDDNRLCYYIGGLKESATSIIGTMSKPVSWGMPADKICFKLYKKDRQICELKYEKTIDLSKVNLKKLKVKELKQILNVWDEMCKGCTEKSDYVDLVERLLPKHDPVAFAKRKQEL